MKDFCVRRPHTAFTLLFLCINCLSALFFFVYYPLVTNVSDFAPIFYYFIQLYSVATTCIAVSCVYTALKTRGILCGVGYAAIAGAMLLIPSAVSTLFSYWGQPYFLLIGAIEAVVIFLQYAAIYFVFAIIQWGIEEKRRVPFSSPDFFALRNPKSAGILVVTAFFALLRLIPESVSVAEYIDNRAGILFFEDTMDIILRYVFILVTTVLFYIFLIYTRRVLFSLYGRDKDASKKNC